MLFMWRAIKAIPVMYQVKVVIFIFLHHVRELNAFESREGFADDDIKKILL